MEQSIAKTRSLKLEQGQIVNNEKVIVGLQCDGCGNTVQEYEIRSITIPYDHEDDKGARVFTVCIDCGAQSAADMRGYILGEF